MRTIEFLGMAGTVPGSRFVVEAGSACLYGVSREDEREKDVARFAVVWRERPLAR